jgi:hypothetical protein
MRFGIEIDDGVPLLAALFRAGCQSFVMTMQV